ncbi:MAG: hypothetical protein N2422_02285 [Rhodobacteraceae bacterium]|nr:hypothetical protein [Paracoccaceae bacterium]
MTDKTFVLGLGAQKAGTSWLHRYIATAPGTDTGPFKEYHVWDGMHIAECRGFRVGMHQRDRPETALRGRMQDDPAAYFDHFEGLLAQPGIRLTADITPSYAGLPAPVLAAIRAGFAGRGIAFRAVFLMRDPVERCISQFGMAERRRQAAGRVRSLTHEETVAELTGPAYAFRTRYDLTVAAIAAAIPDGEVHLDVHEVMFRPANVAALSRFLGLRPRPDFAARRIHAAPAPNDLPDAARREVARFYAGVYRWAAARLPWIEEVWPGFRWL